MNKSCADFYLYSVLQIVSYEFLLTSVAKLLVLCACHTLYKAFVHHCDGYETGVI
jgi:hypothetical protein